MAVAGAIGAALVLTTVSFCAAGAGIGAGAIGAAAAISHVLVLCLPLRNILLCAHVFMLLRTEWKSTSKKR